MKKIRKMKKKTKKPVNAIERLIISSKQVAAKQIYIKTYEFIIKNNHMCMGSFKKIVDDYINDLK